MEPYLVIVMLMPTAKQKHDEGAVAQIIVNATAVMAKDETQAAMKAHRLVPEEHADKTDRLEVRVLSFRNVASRV